MALSLGCFSRIASATVFRCVTASALVSCAKMVLRMTTTAARCFAGRSAIATAIRVEIVRKPKDEASFDVHARRWVVERIFA